MSDGNTATQWVPTGSITVRVPGKVNLYLAVGDRREDGYHELTTVFHAVSLLDEITVRNADMLSLDLSGEGVESLPTDERNLAWQAAELMAEHVGRAPDVAISIEKSIPVAGGMAGGSADAAAVLVAVKTLWGLGVPRRDLHTPAPTCPGWPPSSAATSRARCTAAPRLAPAAARSWPPCSPATCSTGCWPSPTAACPPPRGSDRSTGCGGERGQEGTSRRASTIPSPCWPRWRRATRPSWPRCSVTTCSR